MSRKPPPPTYDQFRAGLTYRDVYHLIYTRRHKRRRGVLGYWHELKQKMYAEYLRQYRAGRRARKTYTPNPEPIPW